MYEFPKDPKKIKQRIKRYERELKKEQAKFGGIHDGAGKRYLLGPLYMLLGDVDGSIKSFQWFEEIAPDDWGEPAHSLCWTLALYRSGNLQAASRKLGQSMLKNLYIIPHILGIKQNRLEIWHGSNREDKEYIDYIPSEIFELWDNDSLAWAREQYDSKVFTEIRKKYIEIQRQLKNEPVGPKRTKLVRESSKLEKFEYTDNEEGEN